MEVVMCGEVDFVVSLCFCVVVLEGVFVLVFEWVCGCIELMLGVCDFMVVVYEWGGVVGVVLGGFYEIFDDIVF